MPNRFDFEDVIFQWVDLKKQKAEFVVNDADPQLIKLKELLAKLFNGKGICRNLMEARFWNEFMTVYRNFLRRVAAYRVNPTQANKQIVIDDLNIERPALGFKYAFIKDDVELWNVFKDYCKWNK